MTDKREAVEKAARDFRESVQKSGGSITYEDARRRVSEAVQQGDRKRSDSNR